MINITKTISIKFSLIRNPLEREQIDYCIEFIKNIYKRKNFSLELKLCVLETISIKHANENWFHVFTDSLYTCNQRNKGSVVYGELFSFYAYVGQYRSAFEGKVETTRIALQTAKLCSWQIWKCSPLHGLKICNPSNSQLKYWYVN